MTLAGLRSHFIYLLFSMKWAWLIFVILVYKCIKNLIDIYEDKISIEDDKLLLEDYSEEKIIGHLDYIIQEALDEYVIFNIQPKNIYYIDSKLETAIVEDLSNKVPDRLSYNLMHNLGIVYNDNYIGELIGRRIYMIVLNYKLDFNVRNSPEGNNQNSLNVVQNKK